MKSKPRLLRNNQTNAESLLWYYLRDRRLAGHKFRRQHPIGSFIADFVCIECRLVVELDGGRHALQVEEDSRRSAYLKSKEYRVIRFWDHDVLKDTQTVLEAILRVIESGTPSPRPSPPQARERGLRSFSGSLSRNLSAENEGGGGKRTTVLGVGKDQRAGAEGEMGENAKNHKIFLRDKDLTISWRRKDWP